MGRKKKEKVELDEVQEEGIVEELAQSNENVEKGLEIIDKQVDEIGGLQEKLAKEKCERVELQAEVEREKNENAELSRENRRLRMSISIFRIIFFFIFTIVVFIGGWYIGTKLVDLDHFLYGDEEINPEEDKNIEFSKELANVELEKFYGSLMSKKGFISKVLNNEVVPEFYDLFNVYEYRLSVVPRVDQQMYEDSLHPYVTYSSFKNGYKKIYGLEDLETIFSSIQTFPKLVDGNKVLFDDLLETGVVVKFDAEDIKYTSKDKVYTMTGKYSESAADFSALFGTKVEGTFELRYKMDDVGNKYIIGMVITKEELELKK